MPITMGDAATYFAEPQQRGPDAVPAGHTSSAGMPILQLPYRAAPLSTWSDRELLAQISLLSESLNACNAELSLRRERNDTSGSEPTPSAAQAILADFRRRGVLQDDMTLSLQRATRDIATVCDEALNDFQEQCVFLRDNVHLTQNHIDDGRTWSAVSHWHFFCVDTLQAFRLNAGFILRRLLDLKHYDLALTEAETEALAADRVARGPSGPRNAHTSGTITPDASRADVVATTPPPAQRMTIEQRHNGLRPLRARIVGFALPRNTTNVGRGYFYTLDHGTVSFRVWRGVYQLLGHGLRGSGVTQRVLDDGIEDVD